MVNKDLKKNSKIRTVNMMIQSALIIILIVLVANMMVEIKNLQGTARVINYAGLVRGATQRVVKLEVIGNSDDELIEYLDDVLADLKYEDGEYNLVSLRDTDYQKKLDIQIDYWGKLKNEINNVRENGVDNSDIVDMSEMYFSLADQTVSAAERYSEGIADNIHFIETITVPDIGRAAELLHREQCTLSYYKARHHCARSRGGNYRSSYQYGEPYSDSDPCRYRKYEESIYQESGNDGRCKKHLTSGHDFRPDKSSNGYPVPLPGLSVENHSQTAD